jgi:hypothetical protein
VLVNLRAAERINQEPIDGRADTEYDHQPDRGLEERLLVLLSQLLGVVTLTEPLMGASGLVGLEGEIRSDRVDGGGLSRTAVPIVPSEWIRRISWPASAVDPLSFLMMPSTEVSSWLLGDDKEGWKTALPARIFSRILSQNTSSPVKAWKSMSSSRSTSFNRSAFAWVDRSSWLRFSASILVLISARCAKIWSSVSSCPELLRRNPNTVALPCWSVGLQKALRVGSLASRLRFEPKAQPYMSSGRLRAGQPTR